MRRFFYQYFARTSRFRHDIGGAAAIEFAFIVPLMVVMFIGTVELSQAITVDRRVNQVASSTGDLVARTNALTTSEMSAIMGVIEQLLKPYDSTPLKLTVLNVAASPSDATQTTVCWSYAHNGGTGSYPKNSPYALPSGVVAAGESAIVAEVQYEYTPLIFQYFMKSTTPLQETYYLKPRLSTDIKFDGNGCS